MVRRGAWSAILLFLFYSPFLYSQVQDSTGISKPDSLELTIGNAITEINVATDSIKKDSQKKPKFYPNPKRSLRLSLLTPGLAGGQLYNRDYWKLPFVYAAYGTSFYFIFLNVNRYNTMVDHYKEFYFLSDPTDKDNYGKLNPAVTSVQVYIKSQDRYAEMSIDQVRRVKDTYRRWRDWSFFSLAAVYALAAIEANVAAHLKTFDLSDDLSMRVQPTTINRPAAGISPGVKLVFVFK